MIINFGWLPLLKWPMPLLKWLTMGTREWCLGPGSCHARACKCVRMGTRVCVDTCLHNNISFLFTMLLCDALTKRLATLIGGKSTFAAGCNTSAAWSKLSSTPHQFLCHRQWPYMATSSAALRTLNQRPTSYVLCI